MKFVVVQFGGIILYDNELETKKNKFWTYDKIWPQHVEVCFVTLHACLLDVSSVLIINNLQQKIRPPHSGHYWKRLIVVVIKSTCRDVYCTLIYSTYIQQAVFIKWSCTWQWVIILLFSTDCDIILHRSSRLHILLCSCSMALC